MKKLLMLVLLMGSMLLSSSANAQIKTEWHGKSINDFYRYVGPDFDIQLGVGHQWEGQGHTYGMTRFRTGVLWVPSYPWVLSFGVTSEINSWPTVAWGGQAEVLHVASGIWGRGGGALDYQARPHFNVGVGWSLFGAELSSMSPGPYDTHQGIAAMATIRIPIGMLVYVLNKY